ncbi:hypothetical protein H3N56_10255 [Cetobacterium sp. 2A]|uniref:hypothetical protein n=1 Tax=Cetobacterium sp. 2A TaxID=2754723 RepID=UPI00163BA6A9|nr:hypothetical protein [Cetobacterium sp. 2A]MBC2856822.1 hypothetical protein [Cetobacterium sp. 2A]
MDVLQNFSFSSYSCDISYFLNQLSQKRPDDYFELNSRNTYCLFNVLIEELNKKENIFFTGKQIKAKHFDFKNGIFVFAGVIHENDSETINLIKNTMRNKTFNQFIKNIKIVQATMKNQTEVNVIRQFEFMGFVSHFFEYYDIFGNFNFEFVVCKRKILYQKDIFIKRLPNGILAIAQVQEPAKISIPIAKDEKSLNRKIKKGALKNLQVGNTFWAVSSIALAVLGVAGTVAIGGTATVAVTLLFGANTIAANTYSIYLDYNDRDSEMDLNTLSNNPLKFSIGELFANWFSERDRKLGHIIYHGTEIFLGSKGLKELAKGFKVKSLLKNKKIFFNHPILGKIQGMEKVLILEKLLFEGYQFADGINGLNSNGKDFKESIKEYNPNNFKTTIKIN